MSNSEGHLQEQIQADVWHRQAAHTHLEDTQRHQVLVQYVSTQGKH